MPRITPETIIAPVIGIALLAALALGGVAFALSRHEEAFRQEELRNLLRSECRLFAERCGQELDMIRAELELLAAQTPPDADGIRRAVAGEPFFVDGFVADRSGRLLHADGDWRRRYNELFTELVSSRSDGADSAPVRPAPQKLRTASSAPAKTGTRPRELVEPVPLHDNARRIVLADQARFSRSAGGEFQPVRRENSERALPAVAAAPEADSPAPRLIPRFAALARGRRSGFIPYFADNRFAPLVWAESTNPPGRLVGFELESVVLWSRLIPLFPQHLPPYFRIELVDASNRVIHAAGGDISGKETAEPVLIMPFSELLLPNAQIRASLIPERLPLGSFRLAVWLGISAPILVILLAGLLIYRMLRRELRLSGQKTGFVSQVSHELKTPLTSIRMYAELLRDHDAELAPARRRGYQQIILDESERLSRLVGNVLDFSRLDAGLKRYSPAETDLAELLNTAAELCRERARTAGVELHVSLPGSPASCRIDRDSLLQILHNLFDNAFKYAASGKRIDLSLVRAGRRWEIRLRDYGPGVPPGAEEKIFRKFYRVDTALEAEVSGFGLGLAIARGLLRDQKGELKAVPADPGMQFIIQLPEEPEHGTV